MSAPRHYLDALSASCRHGTSAGGYCLHCERDDDQAREAEARYQRMVRAWSGLCGADREETVCNGD